MSPVNAFGYNRPAWGLHYCPLDAYCREHGTFEGESVVPWLYIHTPWGSLIIPITLDRGRWPYNGWWLPRGG